MKKKAHNKCEDCGKCCLFSQMILSEKEYKKILKKYPDLRSLNAFWRDEEGFLRMRTINRECVFFDKTTKMCSIYELRPMGCRIYPIHYNFEEQRCKFGELCPKPKEFYPDEKSFKRACNKLKKYLKKEILIENITM